ncbi:MAG: nucleoside 2-deoxyribosyltransferase [Lachnospiraceae bacterium]|nr:nucleoside 2-deoxyribosyltransferase [Lachnospiraceae bacterium]
MKQFNIFLSGGMGKFGKERFDEGNEWRVDLKERLEDICNNYRVHCINPNDYYSFLDDKNYDSQLEIMRFDLDKVRKSEIVIANFNDPESLGSMAEITVAYERNIPVLGLCENHEEIHPWAKEMCNKIFTDRESLVLYIMGYYLD